MKKLFLCLLVTNALVASDNESISEFFKLVKEAIEAPVKSRKIVVKENNIKKEKKCCKKEKKCCTCF